MLQYNSDRQQGQQKRATDSSRRVIDIAVGVLVGLRGYSEREAFDELVEAVRSTGIGIGSLAAALIALVGGRSEKTPYQAEALDFWGETVTARVIEVRSPALMTARAS
jgi:ANTAR domain